MPTRAKKAGRPEKKKPDAAAERRQIPAILILMNRVLSRLSERDALKAAGLGVAEWSVLYEIALQPEQARAGRLAKRLDVTPQRINAVMKSLKELDYVSITRSQQDPRARDVAVSDRGRQHVAAVEADIRALFATAFHDKPALLSHVRNGLKRVADQMPTEKPGAQDAA